MLAVDTTHVRRSRTWVLNSLLLCSFATLPISAQLSPEDSAAKMTVPEGLDLSIWAKEPLFANPTAIDIDSRGRVWIAEGLNYRFFRNGDFKRQPKADRIKILEDTDGDGKADKVTVFAEDIYPVPMGLAIEEVWNDGKYQGTRVFTGNSPDLLVLEDLNGDDVAEKRYPLLTGFGGVDHDHGVHGMSLGPDGKLYFTQGDGDYAGSDEKKVPGRVTCSVTDRDGRKLQNTRYGATYRVNRDGSGLEMLANGQRNDYEACVDAFGNVFVSDNDDDGNMGSRMIWIMDGGDYGYRLTSRHWAEEIPGVVPKLVGTGNGSPCGILIVETDALGPKYNGTVLQIDAGTHQVNAHPLTRYGAAFRTEYDVFLKGEDSYFRPIDASFAPDGSLYVCDWYDAGVGGHRFTDQSSGRILRIAVKDIRAATVPDFGSVTGLTTALASPNVSTRFVARQGLIAAGEKSRPALLELQKSPDVRFRARALAILADLPAGQNDLQAALQDGDPRIREQALRLLTRDCRRQGIVEPESAKSVPPRAASVLKQIAPLAKDPDAGVRRELILALRNLPTANCNEILKQLVQGWDGQDRFYVEALRLALRHREPEFLDEVFRDQLARIQDFGPGPLALPPYFPTATNNAFLSTQDRLPPADDASKLIGLAWCLQRPEALAVLAELRKKSAPPALQDGIQMAVAGIDDPKAAEFLVDWLTASTEQERQRSLLQILGVGLAGRWQALRDSDVVQRELTKTLHRPDLCNETIRTIAAAGIIGFEPELTSLAKDEGKDLSIRTAALEALAALKSEQTAAIGTDWLTAAKDTAKADPLAIAGLSALARSDRRQAMELFIDVTADQSYPADLRRRAIAFMAADTPGALQLLTLHDKKKLPEDLVLEASFLLNNHPDNKVRHAAQRKLSLASMAGGKSITNLDAILALTKDPNRGKEVFRRDASDACARCHRVQGIGNWVGPDLSSIGTKYGEKELLYHILNPSGAIGDTYVPFTFALTDGNVLTGLVTDEDTQRVVLKTAAGERMTIATSDIDDRRPVSKSIMPENLAQAITEQQLADLVSYLASLRQPVTEVGEYFVLGPLPAGSFDATRPVELEGDSNTGGLRWKSVRTSRDQFLDLSSLLGASPGQEVAVYLPIDSPVDQEVRIVLSTANKLSLWSDAKPVRLGDGQKNGSNIVREGKLTLHVGKNNLVLLLSSGEVNAGLTTTLIADQPLRIGE